MSEADIAQQARNELQLTERAFDLMVKGYFEEMMNTAPEQTEKRERLFFAMRATEAAKEALIRAAADGEAIAGYRQYLAEAGLLQP